MTTIIALPDRMVADKQLTAGNTKIACKKVLTLNGHLVGAAGSESSIQKFFRWCSDQRDTSQFNDEDDFEGVVLTPKGIYHFYNRISPVLVDQKFLAVGSGAMAAMACLHCGKTPEEAIAIAAKLDSHTGLGIDVFHPPWITKNGKKRSQR